MTPFDEPGSFTESRCAPLEVDDFLFYANIALRATTHELPTKNPSEYSLDINFGDHVSTLRFTDLPENRMAVSLIEHLDEEERETKLPAIMARIFALLDIIRSGKVAEFVKDDDNPTQLAIHDSLLRVAATMEINPSTLRFDHNVFLEQLKNL